MIKRLIVGCTPPFVLSVLKKIFLASGKSGDTAPIKSGDTAPIESGDTAPIESGDTAPIESGDTAPIESGDTAPIESGDTAPIESGDTAPIESEHVICGHKIFLPSNHGFPIYHSKYKTYDRFIPFLSASLQDGYMLDIGANVGDSLCGMLAAKNCSYYCIEPEDIFFNYLKKNILLLDEQLRAKIIPVNAFITSRTSKLRVEKHLGSAQISETGEFTNAKQLTLDMFIAEYKLQPELCRLIKIDTDGFDYDCIMSGDEFFSKAQPFVFWENFFENASQKNAFKESIDFLDKKGFDLFYVFDNAGVFVCKCSKEAVCNLMDYQFYIHNGFTSLTQGEQVSPHYYFFDILATTNSNECMTDKIIEEYKKNYMNVI